MDRDGQPVAERILNLAIEIICLLTGERFPAVKSGDLVTIAVPPPDTLTVERNSEQKILEVTQKIVELLTAEVPNGSEEVEVSISLEQIVLQEAEKTLEKDPLVENEETPESEDLLEATSTPLATDASVPSPACTNEVPNSTEQDVDMSAMCDPIMGKLDVNSAVDFSSCDEGDLSDSEALIPINAQPTPASPRDSQIVSPEKTSSSPSGTDCVQLIGTGQMSSTSAYESGQAPSTADPLQSVTICTNHVLSDNLQSPVTNHVTPICDGTDHTMSKDPGLGDLQTAAENDHIPTTSTPALSSHLQSSSTDTTEITLTLSPQTPSVNVPTRKKPGPKGPRFIPPHKKPSCPECGRSFRWQSEVLFHMRKHTGERPYCCAKCGQCFSRIPHLVIHERSHTGERPYICSECKKCFTSKSELNEHRKRHRGLRIHPCSECTKSFITKSDLSKHMRSHTGEKPHPCSICGKCFTLRSGVVRHEKTHTGERPFSCTECGKAYVSNSELINHMRTHTGERPFSCIDCGKCFYCSSDLMKHRRCHTGNKPYLCSVCGKSYTSKSVLYRHHKIHTKVKPFTCDACGKCFCKEKTLENHQKIHKKIKPHCCTECGKAFYRPSALAKHMRAHNP